MCPRARTRCAEKKVFLFYTTRARRLLEKYRGVQRLLGCFATAAHGAHWVLYEATYQHAARTFKLRLYDSMGGETKPRLQDATELFSEELGVHYDLSGSVTVVCAAQIKN